MKLNATQIEYRATAATKNLVDSAKCADQREVGQVLCKMLAVVVNAVYVVMGKKYALDALRNILDSTEARTDTYSIEKML